MRAARRLTRKDFASAGLSLSGDDQGDDDDEQAERRHQGVDLVKGFCGAWQGLVERVSADGQEACLDDGEEEQAEFPEVVLLPELSACFDESLLLIHLHQPREVSETALVQDAVPDLLERVQSTELFEEKTEDHQLTGGDPPHDGASEDSVAHDRLSSDDEADESDARDA